MTYDPDLQEQGVENVLKPHQAHPGKIVRVREDFRGPDFAGMHGVVVRSFGSPGYAALDVRLENGRMELFWLYQLESEE